MRMVQSQDDDASQRREEEVKLQEGRKTSRKARVKVNAMTRRKTRMRPRSPRPVTTRRDPVETEEQTSVGVRVEGQTFHHQHGDGNPGTGGDADHEVRELHSPGRQKYRDKDKVNKAKIEGTPQQCNTKHFTGESCSQSRSIKEPMQLSSRGKQMAWP